MPRALNPGLRFPGLDFWGMDFQSLHQEPFHGRQRHDSTADNSGATIRRLRLTANRRLKEISPVTKPDIYRTGAKQAAT